MSAHRDSGRVEKSVSLVLRVGVLFSAALICLGLVLFAAKGGPPGGSRIDAALPFPRDLLAIATGILALDPASVIQLGLLALVATPLLRVAVSLVAFSLERDWRYAAITALVLGILVAGILMGRAVG